MTRRKQRPHDQTDSRSRTALLAARKAGETLRGLGVFLIRDRASGTVSLRIFPDITYEDAVARGRAHEAFKWVERSVWDQACGTHEPIAAAEVSALGASGSPSAALVDPDSVRLVSGPVAYECPQGMVFNPRTCGCEPL
jgi:hypothetical protein